jgi:hypothetical protein
VFLEDEDSSRPAFIFSNCILLTILLSISFLILETLDGPNKYPTDDEDFATYSLLPNKALYDSLETLFTMIFTAEFCLRLLAAHHFFSFRRLRREDKARKQALLVLEPPFFRSMQNWADFAAIIPWYILIFFSQEDRKDLNSFIAMVKCLRVLRIFKISRKFEGTIVLTSAVKKASAPLALPLFFFVIFTFVFGTLMYFVEPCYNYETCNFPDLFRSW